MTIHPVMHDLTRVADLIHIRFMKSLKSESGYRSILLLFISLDFAGENLNARYQVGSIYFLRIESGFLSDPFPYISQG